MPQTHVFTLWPTAENYDRFVAVCNDDMPKTHAAYVANHTERLESHGLQNNVVHRLDFDPAELEKWCKARTGQVDSKGRAEYAAFLGRQPA
jgi:hypothetical protein